MIRILIADDHLVFRLGLRTMLDAEPDLSIVGEANSGRTTVDAFHHLQPDVTLLDLACPMATA